MSLLVVGTVPDSAGEVLAGPVERAADGLLAVGGRPLPSCQGTAAMLGAAEATLRHLRLPPPRALLGGDLGRGDGTRAVLARLPAEARRLRPAVIALHYLQPVMALVRRALDGLAGLAPAPLLVADAGGMYAAKAAGLAPRFELMTPDVGEVGFLADPEASHPAYVSRWLFGRPEFDAVALARRAAEVGGSARVLLVKGAVDLVSDRGEVVARVDAPHVPELEPIGGTGDTITGLAAAFLAAGFPTVDAAVCAARANREAGRRLGARPDHRAADLVARLPEVLGEHMLAWTGSTVPAPSGDGAPGG